MEFRELQYWNSRYLKEDSFEWFESACENIYNYIKEHCRIFLPITAIHVGSGNSKLGIKLDLPYLINVDYSSIVVKNMKESSTEWNIFDITNMPIRDGTIDLVVDKGTLDALLSGVNLWNPEPELVVDALDCLNEIYRILSLKGHYIYATFGQPHFRKPLFNLANLEIVHTEVVGESFHYFIYLLRRK